MTETTTTASDIFRQPVAVPPQAAFTGTVATVNGVEITGEVFQKELSGALAQLQRQYPPEQLAQIAPRIQEQVLNQLIARQLLLQEADRLKMTVSDADFDEAQAKLEASLPPGVTLAEILERRNVTQEQFRQDFGKEVLVSRLIEEATSNKTAVTEAEIEAFYTENKERFTTPETATARHILIAVKEGDDKEAKKAEADAIVERLKAGEDFAKLVEEKSDDPGSKSTGGEYTFPRGQMVPAFEEASFTQEIGEIGAPVETQFGYHIIQVEKREPARDLPLDEVRTNLEAYLRSRKMPEVMEEYLGTLRSNATVTISAQTQHE